MKQLITFPPDFRQTEGVVLCQTEGKLPATTNGCQRYCQSLIHLDCVATSDYLVKVVLS